MQLLEEVIVGESGQNGSRERSFSAAVNALMRIEIELNQKVKGIQGVDAEPSHQRLIEICKQIRNHPLGPSLFDDSLIPSELELPEKAL